MKKIILTIIMGMFLLTCVSAADDDYLGKQYEDVYIIETCGDSGEPCDATFLCNITIIDPLQKVIVLNIPMERNDTIYNYTLTDTDELGIYKIKTYCGNGTFNGESIDGRLEVTTTGKDVDSTLTIIILVIAFVLFLIGLVIKNNSIGFISGILFLISGIYIMIYGFTYVADMYTRAIALVILGFGMIIILTAGYDWIGNY